MNLWALVVILAAPAAAPIDATEREAVHIFTCDFSEATDRNYDAWPDGWHRRRGSGFPLFLPIRIVPLASAGGDLQWSSSENTTPGALRMQLDGGSAAVYSPPIPVSPLFSYRLEGRLKTEGLKHDIAYYSLTFFDADGKLLDTYQSGRHGKSTPWTHLRIGPVMPAHRDTYTAVIGLHLEPRDKDYDLHGTAWFADVKLSRLPRVVLRASERLHLYASPSDVQVQCEVSGVLKNDPQVRFVLLDLHGKELAAHEEQLSALPPPSSQAPVPTSISERNAHRLLDHDPHGAGGHDHHDTPAAHGPKRPRGKDKEHIRGFAGLATWRPPIPGYGFYKIKVSVEDTKATRIERETTIAIARPIAALPRGEFGWSLPQGDHVLTLAELLPLVSSAGIHWLKFPMWYAADDTTRADRLAWFVERVSQQHINLVGVLDTPPPAVKKTMGDVDAALPIASAFVEAPLWQPAVDPVMTRLSLKVRWWQLGSDDDQSFVGYPSLPQKIAEIKQYFLKFGQEVQVGLSWPWLVETPPHASWDFLSRTASPPLTADETATYLQQAPAAPPAQWTMLAPLERKHYPLDRRARDLVERMIAVKIHRTQAAFATDPFDPHQGLLEPDGTPGELFLPWRTTALLLGGAEYLGTLELPGGSENHVFQRGDEAVMMIRNDRPTRETLYLGEEIEHLDLWGRSLEVESNSSGQLLEQTVVAGPMPTFVTGLSLPVAKLRISFAFETPSLPSVFGRDLEARYTFDNPFPQGVGGQIKVLPPDDWDVTPLVTSFQAAERQTVRDLFQVRFKSDAQAGRQLLRFDFRVTADRDYAFSVYQPIEVGVGDVAIETATRLLPSGELVVEQTFVNNTDDFVSFNCLLFAPGRRRERVQVVNLGKGRHTSTFLLPNGEELLKATLLLRAEEIDGDRVLNYRIVPKRAASPAPPISEPTATSAED